MEHASARLRLSWGDLHPELLSLIASKYATTASDYVFLRRVCATWRRSLTDYFPKPHLPSPQLPFLLLPPRTIQPPSPLGTVFPLPFRKPHLHPTSFYLPQLENTLGRICVGSSHGWLITLGSDSSVSLLNPVTADLLPLPPLSSIDNAILNFNPDTFPEYHLTRKDMSHSQFSIINRVILSSDPAKDHDFTVLLFLSDLTDCCFTWSGRGDTWTRHVHRPLRVNDVVFMNGVFITIDRSFTLGFFDFKNRDTGLVMQFARPAKKMPIRDAFLVTFKGLLLIVSMHHFDEWNPLSIPRITVHANYVPFGDKAKLPMPLDQRGCIPFTAVNVRRFRDTALFLGHGCSVSVSVRHFPWLIEGTVYFTHVYSKLEMVEGVGERALHHGAVYQNIIDFFPGAESTKVFDVENSRCANFWAAPRPFWVTPNLNRR